MIESKPIEMEQFISAIGELKESPSDEEVAVNHRLKLNRLTDVTLLSQIEYLANKIKQGLDTDKDRIEMTRLQNVKNSRKYRDTRKAARKKKQLEAIEEELYESFDAESAEIEMLRIEKKNL